MIIMVRKNHAFTELHLATAGIEPCSEMQLAEKSRRVFTIHIYLWACNDVYSRDMLALFRDLTDGPSSRWA